ncbi:MAG: hypothetical protein JSW59_01740 [Phycisphaerales bacterium]|nr:MAG: hypothetical protein JSW59_01740 [Phycisphaerales bacterium]
MRFRCDHCGKEIRVPRSYAGRKGRCPECKAVLTVPAVEPQTTGTQTSGAGDAEGVRQSPFADLTFLDAPETIKTESEPEPPSDYTDEAYEQLRKLQGGIGGYKSSEVQQRKLPWVVDIFLYPFNTKGMGIILLCVGIPLILRFVTKTLDFLTRMFFPMLVFWVPFIIFHWGSLLLLTMYVCWYWHECILDSASGGIRAPETAGITPGVSEILRQSFRTFACFCYSMLPAVVYVGYSQQYDDPICWLLCGFGFFLFPMIILAVAVFDSLLVANPLLVIGSVFSTFFQYLGVVIFCPGPYLLLLLALAFIRSQGLWPLAYLFLLLCFYLNLVLAHVMGRFFWKYRDKLNWEV